MGKTMKPGNIDYGQDAPPVLRKLLLVGSLASVTGLCLLRGAHKAIGIDLWLQEDQGANSKQATLHNAELAGVADRVELYDGDMRTLPLKENTVDAVVASKAIHNISDRHGRYAALQEIMRVLKPAGQVALLDIFCIQEFAQDLSALGLQEVTVTSCRHFAYPPMQMVTGRKRDETQ
jgi:SAM-dependent methyltransferase